MLPGSPGDGLFSKATAMDFLAGDRQASRLQFSWQESRAKYAAVQCLVPKIHLRRRVRGRVGAAGLKPPMYMWPNPVPTQDLKQVPRSVGRLPPAFRSCCPSSGISESHLQETPPHSGVMPPLNAGWVGFRGPQGMCPANYRLFV